MFDFLILGGGIAGLTAARELLRLGKQVAVIEKGAEVGGLARTFVRDGFRFDLGGHRFHSHNPAVIRWLVDLLGEDLHSVPRVSRIKLNGRYVDYPLNLASALTALSPLESAQATASYFLARFSERNRPDHSFEDWVVRRFGWAMYSRFFQPYTEKVWGISGRELSADWAEQRIGLPGIWPAIRHSLRPTAIPPATAISRFHYPRFGFGMIPQALANDIQARGGTIWTSAEPKKVTSSPGGFELVVQTRAGLQKLQAADLISTIPLEQLLNLLASRLQPGTETIEWRLDYRGLICVFLALERAQVSSDSWTYFPERDLIFGRTHEPKNWSAAMVPDGRFTSLGVEIFTGPDEATWSWTDDRIADTVVSQLAQIGWLDPAEVHGRWLLRLRHAYPIYDLGYRGRLAEVRRYLDQWPHLHLIGRTGSFRYMNSDGVIEDVFRFLASRFPKTKTVVQPLASNSGRWA